MRRCLFSRSAGPLLSLLMLACSSSRPAPAERGGLEKRRDGEAETTSAAANAGDAAPAPAQASETPDAGAEAGREESPGEDSSKYIPDDYTLMAGDCLMLGSRFAAVIRSDQMAQISPASSDEKRAKEEENAEKVAQQLSDQWIRGCQNVLVGKVVEREKINCALNSRTMKGFEACINPPADTPRKK